MQSEITLTFHLIPIRMAQIENSRNSMFWQGCGTRMWRILASTFWKDVENSGKDVYSSLDDVSTNLLNHSENKSDGV